MRLRRIVRDFVGPLVAAMLLLAAVVATGMFAHDERAEMQEMWPDYLKPSRAPHGTR